MTITDADIKFLASQRLTDTPDGGGRMTGVVVQDGVDNNIFDDVSSLDRVYGNVSLRKVFGAVLTNTTDKYLGARVIVDAAPADENVNVLLFASSSNNDTREQTSVKVESYLAPGAVYQGLLYGNHLAGQSTVILIQREAVALPTIGQVLLLRKNEGLVDEFDQYVRITEVSSVMATFTDGNGVDFDRRLVTCGLASSFDQSFNGFDAIRLDSAISYTGKARVFNTIVADAAQYFGIANLEVEGDIGDVNIKVDSIYSNLLPSSQVETPLVDLGVGNASAPLVECSGVLGFTIAGAVVAPGANLFLGQGFAPDSLTLTTSNATFTDAGGVLMLGATAVGSVNYASGVVTFGTGTPSSTGTATVSMKAAAAPSKVSDTASVAVTLASRANNYTQTLYPAPMPGSLVVSYRALGQWYDLREQGNGDIIGDDVSIGAGRLTFVTGTATVTLGSLPDVGSEVIFTWCAAADTFDRSASTVPPMRIKHTLAHTGIAPSTFSATWLASAVTKTATDNGSGVIAGDATGTINYATGVVEFTPAVLPSMGANIDFAYQWGAATEQTYAMPARDLDGSITLNLPLGGGEILPKSVELEFNLLIEEYESVSLVPAEMQIAQRVDPIKLSKDNAGVFTDGVTGTINYVSGVVNFMPDVTIGIPRARYSVTQIGYESYHNGTANLFKPVYRNIFTHWEYVPTGAFMPFDPTGYVKVRYRTTGSASAATESITLNAMSFDVTENYNERIVPGSLRFTFGGKTYYDRLGAMVTDVLPATGAATNAGTVDYATGAVALSTWLTGQTPNVVLKSMLTDIAAQPVDEVTFRIPAAPLRVGSVQLRFTPLTGGVQLVTADSLGVFMAAGVTGIVNYETGVVRVRFGAWVAAAGNETKPWYNAAAVFAGQIFKPLPVDAATLRYNAVAYSYLPLEASILGLDPVRLPQDGRVPILKKGLTAVVHNTQSLAPQTVANAQTVDVGRTRLSRLRVFGSAGLEIKLGFTTDLDAGTVTFTNVAGYAQPVTIEHRIEDEALLMDVQITGDMRLSRALTHVFPAGTTKVSSAMIVNTLQAAATESFSQLAWISVWSDVSIGTPIVAQYNQAVYPIVVTNQGATPERWALIFTSNTTFNIVGEEAGVIGTGSVNTVTAPVNPATGVPYFSISEVGWGSGWAAGNVMRFNTRAANFPLWLARTTLQSPAAPAGTDQAVLRLMGDIDV